MAKITETKPVERTFTLEVTDKELQLIERALFKDTTNDDENSILYGVVYDFVEANGVPSLVGK